MKVAVSKLSLSFGDHRLVSHRWAYRKETREGTLIPLLALDSDDHDAVVDLTSITDEAFVAIWRARTGNRLRCRECHAPLHAKRIEATGFRFFAHSPGGPPCPSTGETARHLSLKALFAAAFLRAGWRADFEVAGDDWRADVLVCGSQGQRAAVEVQLATLTLDAAQDRMRRHRAAGVTTLWVLSENRPRWATQFSTVLLDANDFVVDTVLMAGAQRGDRPTSAGAATVDLLAMRWTEGRLTAVEDPEQIWPEHLVEHRGTQYFQLDRCVDNHFDHVRAERELHERSAESLRNAAALAKQARLPAENAMVESLTASPFPAKSSKRRERATGSRMPNPEREIGNPDHLWRQIRISGRLEPIITCCCFRCAFTGARRVAPRSRTSLVRGRIAQPVHQPTRHRSRDGVALSAMRRNGRVDYPCRQKLAVASFDVATVLRLPAMENSAERERTVAMNAAVFKTPKPSSRKEDWIRAGDQERTGVLSVAMSIFNGEADQAAAQLQSQIAELQTSKPASA